MNTTKIEPSIVKLKEVLKRYYWTNITHKNAPEELVLKPLDDLVAYIIDAQKAHLDKREECAYAGTKLLQSVLNETNRNFTEHVQEANDLFLAGMRIAEYIWNLINKFGVDNPNFKKEISKIKTILYEGYREGE